MDKEKIDRIKQTIKIPKGKLSPLKAIKFYCKEMCCSGDTKSWQECSFDSCFLFKYRLGKLAGKTTSKEELSPKVASLPLNFSKQSILQVNQ